jgi:hypothetical protein
MIGKLLNEFSIIPKFYARIAKLPNENFNIFNLLKVEYAEVSTHSMFLADLLNPLGSHGQKDVFLSLFVEKLEIKDFDTRTAKISVEYYIGPKTTTEGGYIDILIRDSRNCIIIENKIYAADQENQLLRYFNYGQKKYKTCHLFYLNLFGDEANDSSTNNKQLKVGEHYHLLSYSKDILSWLESCKKEAVHYPILRETIAQYIQLLKTLTNQNMNQNMSNEIVTNIFENEEKLNAYLALISNKSVENAVYAKIYAKFKVDLEEVARKLNLQLLDFKFDRENPFSIFSFSNEALKQFNLKVTYIFERKNMQGLLLGLRYDKYPNEKKIPKEIKEQFDNTLTLNKIPDWFLCYKEHDTYRNWGPLNHAKANDGTIAKDIEKELISILETFKELEIK